MPTFKIGGIDAITQSNDDVPVIPATVLNNSITALDTTASNGATSNADNTALPLFGCRAFVNFDGTSVQSVGGAEHCQIRSSGNVSKVVRIGTGIFEIYFVNQMPDINYVMMGSGFYGSGAGTYMGIVGVYNNVNYSDSVTTTYIKIAQTGHDGTNINCEGTMLTFFR